MERTPLDSRAVVSAAYDAKNETLELEFASGRIYQYAGVPRGAYDWLLRAPSKGAFVSRMISDRYAYRDVTPAPTEPEPDPQDLAEALRASIRARHVNKD